LSYDASVQKVQIDDNLGGVDNVTVHVANAQAPTQFWLNAAAGQGSTLKIDAAATTLSQKYAIGNFPANWQIGTLAGNVATASLAWTPGAPVPAPTPALPVSVAQKFSINNLALLQYFGGTGNDCVINNTSTNALMVGGGGNATLVGGTGSNELLSGAGTSQLIGRGTIDYLLANYTVDYTGVVTPNKGKLVQLATTNGNYLYGWPTSAVYVLTENATQIINVDAARAFLAANAGLNLTPTAWLRATFYSPATILAIAQAASMLDKVPDCPDETTYSG
jgi:Ca2+-binding RTX toxin-like protein